MFSCHSYFFLLFVYQDGQTATTEVHSISSLLRESQELSAFPGPLKPGETYKNNVIKFCERKIFSVAGRKDIADKETWEMLVLLLRQKGQEEGSDLAELLLRHRERQEPVDGEIPGQ